MAHQGRFGRVSANALAGAQWRASPRLDANPAHKPVQRKPSAMQHLRRGSSSPAVAEVRRMLPSLGLLDNTDPGGLDTFDEDTELAIRHFQQRRGISVDGSVGAETYLALTGAHWRLGDRVLSPDPAQPLTGDDVTALQVQLLARGYDVVRADGVFGATTAEGTRAFQRDYGLVADGICGFATFRALRQLGRRV